MSRQAVAYFRTSHVDHLTRRVTFELGEDPASLEPLGGLGAAARAVERLVGTPVLCPIEGEPAGEIARAQSTGRRLTISAYITDDAVWDQIERGACSTARLSLYGSSVDRMEPGRLRLISGGGPSDIVLRGATLQPDRIDSSDEVYASVRAAEAAMTKIDEMMRILRCADGEAPLRRVTH